MMIIKNWGFERIIHNGEYCCKALVYTKAIASSLHYHVKKHETFYIVEGYFKIEIGDSEIRELYPTDFVVLPPGTKHRVRCMDIAGGIILESSTHDDPSDCVRLEPSET